MGNNTIDYSDEINQTWESLKDFQKNSVDYVYDQLYNKNRKSFLIADEVGLGKTIIAKGLIAKAYQDFIPSKKNPTFNVIYICSNQSLAKTNLKKLNFSRDENLVENPLNRLIYLAFNDREDPHPLRFDSLTPSTSFNLSNRSGVKYERAIIYALLANYKEFFIRKNGLKWLLKGGVSKENWEREIKKKYTNRKDEFRPKLFKQYKEKLKHEKVDERTAPKLFKSLGLNKPTTVWNVLLKSCTEISWRNYKKITYKNELIFLLRHILTKICLEYLSAELIILDEFQRYSDLIDNRMDKASPAIELARAVFDLEDTKVLMLSATPFKPYTTLCDEDHGENHYQEFMKVLEFLMKGKHTEFWRGFEEDRRKLFSLIYSSNLDASDGDLMNLSNVKSRIQNMYMQGMVRTERTLVSDDKNLMVKSIPSGIRNKLTRANIIDFITLDMINQKISEVGHFRSLNPVEFSKSCPYALSFLNNYSLRKNLKKLIHNPEIADVLKKQKSAWIDLAAIRSYKPLGKSGNLSVVPNARLQELMEATVQDEAWKWLWIPPTINYYKPNKIFPAKSTYSKTLLFSSWLMVPRAISSILSYESERLAISAYYKKRKEKPSSYFSENKKRKPRPLLQIRYNPKRNPYASMNLLTLLYPSKFLQELFDPEENIFTEKSLDELINDLSNTIKNKFYELHLDKFVSQGGESDRWYWASLLLFDNKTNKASPNDNDPTYSMFYSILTEIYFIGAEEKIEKQFLDHCKSIIFSQEELGLGEIPSDLFRILAIICLASPAIIFARSLTKNNKLNASGDQNRVLAYLYARAKVKYLDKPESITIIRSIYTDRIPYWEAVLNYCLEGNIQSMTDEYIHMLTDCDFLRDSYEVTEKLEDVLSLRTVNFKIDDYSTIKSGESKNIRTHFAVDFGNQEIETEGNASRRINVRETFNSPYRPFVLASTSIGQEGLDFHYYCSRLVHWNLPHNAIDLEQREGRVNRYKSHVIRKNLVAKYLNALSRNQSGKNIWDDLFSHAWEIEGNNKGKCDLVPFWHIEPFEDNKIERIVPLYPFSKDIAKYARLKEILTFYRMTFGQPRQEELVEVLIKRGFTESEIEDLIKHAMIDLTPPKMY